MAHVTRPTSEAGGAAGAGHAPTSAADRVPRVRLPGMGFRYRTARAEMMVGSLVGGGTRPTLIGPAHATIGSAAGGRRNALCGAYVTHDDDAAWPPDPAQIGHLCPTCTELATW